MFVVVVLDAGKALNRVMIGGLLIQSDSMDTTQLADLTRQLQESLKMQVSCWLSVKLFTV